MQAREAFFGRKQNKPSPRNFQVPGARVFAELEFVLSTPTGRGHLPLEGLSKHNFNLAAFYEKGPISMRAAYSWRSQFLQTATDVIFPYFPIYNASTGQLDASIFLSLNKHIKIGVQGVNLTDEVTKTLAQFTPSGLKGPRSNFINDRRYSFILRGNF